MSTITTNCAGSSYGILYHLQLKKIFLTLCVALGAQFSMGQSFTNGDLEDLTGNGIGKIPPGWTMIPTSSPVSMGNCGTCATTDVLDAAGPIAGAGIVGNPQSGATFVSGYMMLQSSSFRHEGLQQTVNCLIPGITYEISFYQANVKQSSTLDPSGGWSFFVDNVLIGNTAPTVNTLAFTDPNFPWELRTFSFTATAASHNFQFMPWDDDANNNRSTTDVTGAIRMGIDNIVLTAPQPQITPAGATLCPTDPPLNLGVNITGGTWTGPGITNASTGEFDPSVSGTGTHEIIYTISGGCSSIADTINVTVSCVLPVELTSFTGTPQEEHIDLNWTTVSEQNSSHFILDRMENGVATELAQVPAQGNSQTTKNYGYPDLRPKNGVNYYRLTGVDLDGSISHEETIAVKWKADEISLYPNPASSEITIDLLDDEAKSIAIIGLDGRLVERIETSTSQLKWDVKHLPDGVYQIRIEKADEFHQIRFVKKR